jgi:hypothetical protein
MKSLGSVIAVALGLVALNVGVLASTPAAAKDLVYSGKLLLTGGVTNVEGAGGSGLTTWATITGYETQEGWGGNVHYTDVELPDFKLRTYGVAVGLFDRVELSYARQNFDTGSTGGKLGLGDGYTFDQDVVGAKVRVAGDAIYDKNAWMPQISVGAEYKKADRGAIIHAVGGKDDSGVDYYVAATKVLLDQSLVLDGTIRATKANQFGLLGFGGDKSNGYSAQFEGTAAYLVTKHLAVGADYRTKPDNLGFAKEDDSWDAFAAYAINKHLSVTAAYVDLGSIATFKGQRGAYLSLQAGF